MANPDICNQCNKESISQGIKTHEENQGKEITRDRVWELFYEIKKMRDIQNKE